MLCTSLTLPRLFLQGDDLSQRDGSLSLTPRTDAAERFFIDPGRPPVGYVSSSLARILEVELGRALAALAQVGAQEPAPLDRSTLAALESAQRPKRSVLSKMDFSQGEQAAPAAAPQAQTLSAQLADAALGQARNYADGAVLFRRGERAENVFLLLAGQVRVSDRQAGSDATVGPGQVLAAHSLFDGALHTETVHAIGEVQAVLLGSAGLRDKLAPDTSLLASTLMGLSLQQYMVAELSSQAASGQLSPIYSLLGERTYTGPELQRELVEAKTRQAGEGMSVEQLMCFQLQAGEQLPLAVLRGGQALGQAGLAPDVAPALMIVSGKVSARWGGHAVELGQGSVIGLAEALSGQAFAWDYTALQDLNVRQWPVERALQHIERADPLWRTLAAHFCAGIARRQQEALG
jgi:CRP-like cAMP-binding protein